MTDFIARAASVLWAVSAFCLFLFIVLRVAGAASNDRWAEGCFWLLAFHVAHQAKRGWSNE